jgi:NAD(P)-dependent dehydrogenase (short-subunit alcohol dehydrogenase family)
VPAAETARATRKTTTARLLTSAPVAALTARLADQVIDVLINNAGTLGPDYPDQTAYTMDFEGFADALAVNTIAPVRMMQALLPNLRASRDPKVVNITSQMGAISLDMTMGFAYCSSKAALNKFMKLAAQDLRADGIAVCVIHPGWVKTDMGGPNAQLTPQESASGILKVLDGFSLANTGSFWKWDGEPHPW